MNIGQNSFMQMMMLSIICCVASICFGEVNVRKYGAVGNGKADDTAAIQKAADEAERLGVGLLFPSGKYKISKALEIGCTKVRGESYPQIIQSVSTQNIFYSAYAWRMTICGIEFKGGSDQLSLGNNNLDKGFLQIIDCRFNGANGVAIRISKKTFSTMVVIEKCVFEKCMQALIATTDHTVLRDCWITSHSEMKDKAVIENYGVLVCENVLGVPLVNGKDQRWIDNYYMLTCKSFRFGGEGGGFTPVLNFAKPRDKMFGSMVILDSCHFVAALGNNQRPCVIYCEEIPNHMVIRDSNLGGIVPVMINPKIDISNYFKTVKNGMFRIDVKGNLGEMASELPESLIRIAKQSRKQNSYGLQQLTLKETENVLNKAQRLIPKTADRAKPMQFKDYKQQIVPTHYIELLPEKYEWDLNDYMDGTREKNSEYLGLMQTGDDVMIVRRIAADKNWPHVAIKGVEIDLDNYSVISWKIKDNGLVSAGYAVKITDTATKNTILLAERHWKPFFDYHAYDLKKIFGYKGGKRKFEIKFYFLGYNFKTPTKCINAKKGDVMLIDFIRFEMPEQTEASDVTK